MNTLMLIDFKTVNDHDRFLSWLSAWEYDKKTNLHARINFVRNGMAPLYSRWTLIENEEVFHAAQAFNAMNCPETPEPEETEQDLALLHATEIMEGFLSRFPAPECVEQAEVVSRAEAWLANFAGKAISQNNNNTHTD